MIPNASGGKEYYKAKQEADNSLSNKNTSSSRATSSTTTSSSRQWAGFRNPRIVRVSRSFGGKDRHSKVCTIKGLRDRRIRLSVPTAIQLYDLQDRLGLSQPSKVIDWLIENTKDDIDELPPLQMPLNGDFSQFHQVINPHHDLNSSSQLSFSQFFTTPKLGTKHGNSDERMKGKEVGREESVVENGGLNIFPIPQPSFPPFPYNPYYNWEPSNLSLSQFGPSQGLPIPQTENSSASHSSLSLLPSSLALPPVSQLFLAPSPSLFPPYMPTVGESSTTDIPRQFNHFQFLNSSTSQHVLPNASLVPGLNLIDSQNKTFALNLNSAKFHSSLHNGEGHDSQLNKGKGGSTF